MKFELDSSIKAPTIIYVNTKLDESNSDNVENYLVKARYWNGFNVEVTPKDTLSWKMKDGADNLIEFTSLKLNSEKINTIIKITAKTHEIFSQIQ